MHGGYVEVDTGTATIARHTVNSALSRFCNTDNPSSIFVSSPSFPSIESLSKSTISSLGSGSFGRNIYGVNIQQRTTSKVANIETVMADNEELYPPPPQYIYDVFAAVDLSYRSSSDSDKYKHAWLKAKVIWFYILSAGECPDAYSTALSISPNHKEITPILVGDRRHFPKKYANTITRHEQIKNIVPCNISQ